MSTFAPKAFIKDGVKVTDYEDIAEFFKCENEQMKARLEAERQKNAETLAVKDARIRELEAMLAAKQ